MLLQTTYHAPLGKLVLTAAPDALLTVSFDATQTLADSTAPILAETMAWLDRYFAGTDPGELPPIRLEGTPFQQRIWRLMQGIPYGYTTSYGTLARQAAAEMKIPRMSAQAVGGAVRRNPIAILIPCHRVIGSNGNLTGYFGGMERKIKLLELEGLELSQFTLPK